MITQTGEVGGLTYGKATIQDLVNKDTDLDGVLDWEENLWGTDLARKDTDGDGIGDEAEIENFKKENRQNENLEFSPGDNENLTETDKFSREFFATIATLSQNGQMDQATIDKLSSSLAEHIQNSTPRKVFSLSDVKIINGNDKKAIEDYGETLIKTQAKYPVKYNVIDVLQKFIIDENNVDVSVLSELDPIISQKNKLINAMVKMSVPLSLSTLHLDVINSLERLVENTNDMKLYETDVIVSLSAISQYQQNTVRLSNALNNLGDAINQKLSN